MNNTSQLFIPPKLRVGCQKRSDTYTGQLAYVIYYDLKGVLRQATSWESWRDKKIEPQEFDNVPTEGFVLNKGVGGQRESWGHHARNEYIRVWDPRNFEFEISVANLLFILREGACHPGKGLDGKFVYAWQDKKPVLLPITSVDYKLSQDFTALQNQKVGVRQLVPGRTYRTRRQEDWVYLGKFDFFYSLGDVGGYKLKKGDNGITKKLVFAELRDGKWRLHYEKDPKAVAVCVSENQADNFAELVELHTRSARGSKIVKLLLKPVGEVKTAPHRNWEWWTQSGDGIFSKMQTDYNGDNRPTHLKIGMQMSVRDGILWTKGHIYGGKNLYAYHPDYREKRYIGYGFNRNTDTVDVQPASPNPWIDPTSDKLFALLECGAEVEIGPWALTKE
jgi:hypothetical protein